MRGLCDPPDIFPRMHGLNWSCVWAGRQLSIATFPQSCEKGHMQIQDGSLLARCWMGECSRGLCGPRIEHMSAMCNGCYKNGVLSARVTHGLIVYRVRQPCEEGGANFCAWVGALCVSAWAGTKILEVSSLSVIQQARLCVPCLLLAT